MFPRVRLAVFVDGCFWHGCPQHHTVAKANALFWADKIAATKARDEETNKLLTEHGWTVIRVWEHAPVGESADRIERLARGGSST